MAVRQYVGARYVPKFYKNSQGNGNNWEEKTPYEALTVVTYNSNSYTSKIPVPENIGNPANNPNYWVLTGNYNAQVEEYRKDVESIKGDLTTLNILIPDNFNGNDTQKLQSAINAVNENGGIICINRTYILSADINIIFNTDKSYQRIKIIGIGKNAIINTNGHAFVGNDDNANGGLECFNVTFIGNGSETLFNKKLIRSNFTLCNFSHYQYIYNSTSYQLQQLLFSNCYFNDIKKYVIYAESGIWHLVLDNCTCEHSNGFYKNVSGNSYNVTINNCVLEGLTEVGIYTGASYNLSITNNYFEKNAVSIDNQGATNEINIEGNIFFPALDNEILIRLNDHGSNPSYGKIINNTCEGTGYALITLKSDQGYYGFFYNNINPNGKVYSVDFPYIYGDLILTSHANKTITFSGTAVVVGTIQELFNVSHRNIIGVTANYVGGTGGDDFNYSLRCADNNIIFYASTNQNYELHLELLYK